jgi:hypothetical protein
VLIAHYSSYLILPSDDTDKAVSWKMHLKVFLRRCVIKVMHIFGHFISSVNLKIHIVLEAGSASIVT